MRKTTHALNIFLYLQQVAEGNYYIQSKLNNKNHANELLDKTDRKILNILQKNNQITNQAFADKVGISVPPCFRRIKRLHNEGIILHDVSLVNLFKVKKLLIVFVNITLEKQGEDFSSHFERKMSMEPKVMQCYFVSGYTDYLLIVHVKDMNNESARVFAIAQQIPINFFHKF